jgi:hypothetical protein
VKLGGLQLTIYLKAINMFLRCLVIMIWKKIKNH